MPDTLPGPTMAGPPMAAPPPIRCAISPDADDLFMFRALIEGLIDTDGLSFEIVTRDTDLLNRMATAGPAADALPDVTAISIAWYPAVAATYQLLAHGGSVGRGYGPVVITTPDRAAAVSAWGSAGEGPRVAVPGLTTTAYLILRLLRPTFTPTVVPIVPPSLTFAAVREGKVDAALVIHEGRLTYADEGFVSVLDIGEAWAAETGLPLPLGGNVIRRGLGPALISRVDRVLRASIAHALADREAAMDWLLARGGALQTRARVDHYLSLYANADTLDYGADGRRAIVEVLRRGAAGGWIPSVPDVDFVGG